MKTTRFSVAPRASARALWFLAVLASFACQPQQEAKHVLLSRAPADLDCPESEVTARSLEDGTAEARGCGLKAVYVESCQRNFDPTTSATLGMPTSKKKCQWELESRGPDR